MWNKEDFRGQKSLVIKYIKKTGCTPSNVSYYGSLNGVPLTVLYEFIKEDLPQHTKVCDVMIDVLNNFYTVGE